ncbi:MAG TPA: class I SAM-dependent methyltransferase [Nocardioidaceae bacterium]|nr:class I SAM-dependent methyltransferase [Nocardioidaceae bacterium]
MDHLDPPADARLLEVGCGPGAAAELLGARLVRGRLLAVDRSPTAVRRTAARNAVHVEAGRLEVVESSLADLERPAGSVDAAFAVDVNVFWLGPAVRELEVLLELVRAGGWLHLVYGAGPAGADRVVDGVTRSLRLAGVLDVAVSSGGSALAVCGRRPEAVPG